MFLVKNAPLLKRHGDQPFLSVPPMHDCGEFAVSSVEETLVHGSVDVQMLDTLALDVYPRETDDICVTSRSAVLLTPPGVHAQESVEFVR